MTRSNKYGVRWSAMNAQWEVLCRGDEKPTYYSDLNEAIEKYKRCSGGKGNKNVKTNGSASPHNGRAPDVH